MHQKKISFQGLKGAFSDLACKKFYKKFVTVPCETFEETIEVVDKKEADLALIPVENNIAGRVADMHSLFQSIKLKIIAEHYLRIEHNLLINKNSLLKNVKFVYSHIHALSQCKKNIKKWKLKPINFMDTAGAAKFISKKRDNRNAAIASKLASDIYDLKISKRNIEDNKNNVTRFLVFSRKQFEVDIKKKTITTIIFNTKNTPAALYKALGGFAQNGINLTRLESFFVNKDFKQFSFLIDVESHPKTKGFIKALEILKSFSYKIKILGFYEASSFRK